MQFTIFDGIMLGLNIVVIGCVIFSVFRIKYNRKQFGSLQFIIHNKPQKFLKRILLMFLLVTFIEITVATTAPDLRRILSIMLVATSTFIYSMNNGLTNGISENGLLLRGYFVCWEKIKKFTIQNEMIVLTVLSMSQNIEFESDIAITFDLSEKDGITNLLRKHISD